MLYLPRGSREWSERFWHRPLDAVPMIYGSGDINSLAPGIETGVLFEGDVPPQVNGFRIEHLMIGTGIISTTRGGSGGLLILVYNRTIRNAGASFKVPQFYQFPAFAGVGAATIYPVAWLIGPADHWQATLRNDASIDTVLHSWVGLDGWYF